MLDDEMVRIEVVLKRNGVVSVRRRFAPDTAYSARNLLAIGTLNVALDQQMQLGYSAHRVDDAADAES